jgi:hypothetical protein
MRAIFLPQQRSTRQNREFQQSEVTPVKATKTLILFVLAAALIILTAMSRAEVSLSNASPETTEPLDTEPKKSLRAFRSEKELKDFFKQLAEERKRQIERSRREAQQKPASPNATANTSTGTLAQANGPADQEESITNVQHAGVDEGGIVKLHGDHLVVLRRGRLFTVRIGDNSLKPISMSDAFGPEINPRHTWYDEMLISDNTIAVIGYSYERGGTEIGIFNIDDAGHLRYRSTYHLRSNDYYSSRNYASRLIAGKLIFYTPLYLWPDAEDPFSSFPAIRRWHRGAKKSEFQRIVSATSVYRQEEKLNIESGMALHTVTVCDIDGGLSCKATAVVAAPGRVFYVSPESVYVWTSDWARSGDKYHWRSMLYRMPLDGSGPSALKVSGSPVDQFSFLESQDGHLNVLVRSDSSGDGMWGAEYAAGDLALMRTPLGNFSDGSEAVPQSGYRKLPKPEGYTFQNRFVGDYLLYGTGSGWGAPVEADKSNLYAVRWSDGETTKMRLGHGVDRIEAMGSGAVVVGTDGRDLHFTGVRLGESPQVAERYTRKGASQGELRSHGFFYKPDGPDSGLLGLPIRGEGRPGYEHLFDGSASILFLRNESLGLKEVGELRARTEKGLNDGCRASCVDWYGNARPLFLRGRVFALLGYELVEGNLSNGHIRELRRINYAPGRRRMLSRN